MASNEKSRNVRLPNIVEALLPIVVMMGLMIYGLNFSGETYVDAHMPLAVSIVAFSRSTMPASMSEKLWPQKQPTAQATTMDTASGMWEIGRAHV